MTTIQGLAKEHEMFIRNQLHLAEQTLIPSSTEDEELMRRAVFAVRNKSIVFERYISGAEMLYATVQDVRPAMVEVSFLKKTIACSCPQKQLCRHKLGVLLSLYQHFESVQDWSAAWRATKTVQLRSLADERTPESWMKMADEVLSRMLISGKKLEPFMLAMIRDEAMTKLGRLMPFEREWQPLYKLFMEIMILGRVWQHLNDTNADTHNGYYSHFVERSRDAMASAMEELSGKSRLFATDSFYDALQDLVRRLLLERSGEFAKRLDIYMLFWEVALYEKIRRERELSLLEELQYDPVELNGTSASFGTTGATKLVVSEDTDLVAARTLFYILLHETDKIDHVQAHIESTNVMYFYELASFAKRTGETWALERLLRFMLPYLKGFLFEWLSPIKRAAYVRDIHALYEGMALSEDEEMALYGAFGMFGLQPFSTYLIQNGRYMEWAALHQLYPSSVSYLEICGLKDVIVESPAVTLPLLHVYAMEEVRGRSRLNYKQAVRIWKRMKTAAKKAGKTVFFDTYMQTIRAQNKRLRALQEEIEKGNLLV